MSPISYPQIWVIFINHSTFHGYFQGTSHTHRKEKKKEKKREFSAFKNCLFHDNPQSSFNYSERYSTIRKHIKVLIWVSE